MAHFKNRLLNRLDADDLLLVQNLLEHVVLETRAMVVEAEAAIDWVYFPEDATLSILALAEPGDPIEIGMVGFEGMSDFATDAHDISPFRFLVQVPGASWRIAGPDFSRAVQTSQTLGELTRRYRQSLLVQFGFNSLSHGTCNLSARLARWLLMSFDRAPTHDIPLVHHFVASLLAVRRSGVTTALHILEGEHAIKATRGRIRLLDRDKLRELASEIYGPAEAHYERVLGQPAQLASEG